MSNLKLLFLDFDGVLHPCTAGTFIYLDRFQEFLRQHPDVRIVLSTSWRLDYAWDDLMALFAADLRERFIGRTPLLSDALPACRELEVRTWLRENHAEHLPYAILDDDVSLFTPGYPLLVLCETIRGLRPAQLSAIERLLGLT